MEYLEQNFDDVCVDALQTEEGLNAIIKWKFRRISEIKKLEAELLNSIREDLNEKRLMKGEGRVTLSNAELLYIIEMMLTEQKTATKITKESERFFGKPEGWGKKVLKFQPIREQLSFVIEQLVNSENKYLALINKHRLLNKKELLNSSCISVVLSQFKRAIKFATMLENKNSEITLLKQQLLEKDERQSSIKELLLSQRSMSNREKVIHLSQNCKELTKTDIAEIVGITRPTVYSYLKET